jgi:hypothetical protein
LFIVPWNLITRVALWVTGGSSANTSVARCLFSSYVMSEAAKVVSVFVCSVLSSALWILSWREFRTISFVLFLISRSIATVP